MADHLAFQRGLVCPYDGRPPYCHTCFIEITTLTFNVLCFYWVMHQLRFHDQYLHVFFSDSLQCQLSCWATPSFSGNRLWQSSSHCISSLTISPYRNFRFVHKLICFQTYNSFSLQYANNPRHSSIVINQFLIIVKFNRFKGPFSIYQMLLCYILCKQAHSLN